MQYSYTEKGDHLTIYKGKKKVHTPNGNVVIANDETMAELVIKQLEAEASYTSPASLLCYHFTYCDLVAQFETPQVANDIKQCVEDNAEFDPLLMFRNDDIEPETAMARLISDITTLTNNATIRQLTAIIVLYCSFDSLALSLRIITDILQPKANGEDYKALKQAFIDDLKQFCEEEELTPPNNLSAIIDAFAKYYA